MQLNISSIYISMIVASVSSLIYPGNLGVIQFLCGYGIAVDELELENVVTGAIFSVFYPLPTTSQTLTRLNVRQINGRHNTENRGKFEVEKFGTYRWIFYKALELMAENRGYEGKACLLRSICESSETPFHHWNGLLAELLYIVLTPSSSNDTSNDTRYMDYVAAEHWGHNGGNCSVIYQECKNSILEQFTMKSN